MLDAINSVNKKNVDDFSIFLMKYLSQNRFDTIFIIN